jgi:gliding motility-associated-like protein
MYQISDANGNYFDTLFSYITVVNCPTPVAQFAANSTRICPGDCINFTDQSQNMIAGQSSWAWSFPGSDSTVSVQQNPGNICYQIPGVYTVILTATNSTDTDTEVKLNYITVDSCLPPVADFAIEKDKICQNTCVRLFNRSLRADSIQWKFFGATTMPQGSSESNPIVCYSDTGLFDVQLMAFNPYGGPGIELKQDYVSVKAFPTIQAPADESVLIGQSVTLRAFGSGNGFRWSPDDGSIDCPFCARVSVSPLENTKYYVTNINENGCERTDSVNVIVIENYYRGVPDAFSPNGDEENDVLYVYGNGISKLELYIYNRQGKIVFESRSKEIGWDGTFNGELMEAGVYAYFVMLTYESGFQEILKGDVTLVR